MSVGRPASLLRARDARVLARMALRETIMLDASDASGDPEPVSLAALLRANCDPPLPREDVHALETMAVGERVAIGICGGATWIRRVS